MTWTKKKTYTEIFNNVGLLYIQRTKFKLDNKLGTKTGYVQNTQVNIYY